VSRPTTARTDSAAVRARFDDLDRDRRARHQGLGDAVEVRERVTALAGWRHSHQAEGGTGLEGGRSGHVHRPLCWSGAIQGDDDLVHGLSLGSVARRHR
jgi:hypothetical protein